MEQLIKNLLIELGEDPDREGLKNTPKRVAKTLGYLTGGYNIKPDRIIREAIFDAPGSSMVVVKDIELFSMCEHHMLPFFGKCHVAYLPDKKIIGLSKIPRIVNCFSRRLQLQERLSHQIAETLTEFLKPKGIAVIIEARHMCMIMRGIRSHNSSTITENFTGDFQNSADLRRELYMKLGMSSGN